jgi:hypothetical protein
VHLTDPQPPLPRRPRWAAARPLASLAPAAAAAVLAAAVVAACGSAQPAASTTAAHQDCNAVAAVLSDGPDPTADPAGYAQAQVLPLRQLKISDSALAAAVSKLASGYATFSTATGSANTAAALQVSKDEAAVNAICPGVAN